MEQDFFHTAENSGSGNLNQQNIRTASATGFTAAADEHAERSIDLNEQLIKNKAATFFLRVNSNAMLDAGIHKGDVVIVDRSLEAKSGNVIIAVLNGEMLIRRMQVQNSKIRLLPETKRLSPIEIDNSSNFSVWGVVTYVIHNL